MRFALHAVSACFFLAVSSLSVGAMEPVVEFQSFTCPREVGGSQCERKYLLYLPKTLKTNAPLLFVLHGYRGDARDYMGEMGMNA